MSSKNKTKSQSPSKSWVSELPDSDEDTECVDIEEPSNAKLSVPENCTCCNKNDTRDEYIMALLSRGVHAKDACNSEPAGKVKSATQTTKIATQIDKLLDSINVNEIAEKCKFAPFSQMYDDDLFDARFGADKETKFLNTLNDSEEQKNFFLKPNWSDGYEDDEYDSDQEEDEDILYSQWKEKPSLRDTLHQFFLIKKWRNSDNPGENLMLEVLKSNTEHPMSDDEHYPHLQEASKKKKVKKKRAVSVAAFASALKKPASLDEMDKFDTGKHVEKTEASKSVEKTEKPVLVDKPETSKNVDGKSCPPPPPSVVDEKTKMIVNFQLAVREGTVFFLKCEYARCADSYKRVRKDFADVLRNTCSVQERCIFTYIFCLSRVLTHSYEEIIDSLHDLKVDLPASFHLKSYGVAVAYQSLNRHSTALEHVRAALKSCADVRKMFYPYCYCQYLSVPSVDGKPPPASQPSATVKKCSCNLIALPESNPDQLKSRLEELHRDCNVPRVATARCKYESCLRISTHVEPSNLIFTTDPDFSGYVCVYCEERCRIEYHHHCWKAYKESTALDVAVKLSDKDFIGKHCPTEDCKTSHNSPSCIVKINIFGADNEIKSSQTKPTAGIIMTGGSRRRDEDDEKSAVVGAGKKNKKKEEEEEKCGGKKKKQRVDSVESTPVKKAKKKEVVIGEKSNKASRDGDASVKRKENDDDREEEKVEEVVPQKKGKHKKIKYFCIDGFNRGASGSNKHPQRPSSKVQGRTTAVKSSDTQAARYFVLSLEEELELLAMLRENRFGIPFQEWMDVSDDYFGNSGLVKDQLVEERYSRTLSEVQKLLLDLYRSYLKEQSPKFGLDILNHVEKTFWNLSWTPARDFLSSFDPIASSGVYKTVSQFLSSSGEFVIIGDKLCLAQYLSFCVESVVNSLDVSFILDSEHVIKAGREYIVEVEEDEDVRKQVFVHVKEVEETKLKTELSVFGKVKRVDQLKERKPGKRAHSSDSLTPLLVTFSDTFAAEAARKYSRHIVHPVASAKPFMSASGKTRVYTESPIYDVNSVAKASTASESSANSIACFQDNVPRGMNVKDDRSATHVTSETNSLGSETQSVWSESQSVCSESQSVCSESQSVCSGTAGDVDLDGDYEDTTSMGTEENDEVEGNNQEILENEPFDTVQKFEQTLNENTEETLYENNEETLFENNEDTLENTEVALYENTEETLYENNEETLFENNEDTLENTEVALYENNEETLCENNENKHENTEEVLYDNNEETLCENNEDKLENTEEALYENNEETLCENNEDKLENTEEVLYDNNEETLCENNEEKLENTEEVLYDNNEETLCENNEEKLENTEEVLYDNNEETLCENNEEKLENTEEVLNENNEETLCENNEEKFDNTEEALCENVGKTQCTNVESEKQLLDTVENVSELKLISECNENKLPSQEMETSQISHEENYENTSERLDSGIENIGGQHQLVEHPNDMNTPDDDENNENLTSMDIAQVVRHGSNVQGETVETDEKEQEEVCSNVVENNMDTNDRQTDYSNERKPSTDGNHSVDVIPSYSDQYEQQVHDLSEKHEEEKNEISNIVKAWEENSDNGRTESDNENIPSLGEDSNDIDEACETNTTRSNLNVKSCEFQPNAGAHVDIASVDSEASERRISLNNSECEAYTYDSNESRPHSNLNVNSVEFSPNTSLSRKVDDHESEVYETNTNSNEPYCQKLLLDLYRSYLKEQSPKFGLDILSHVEKTFWNLSWTPVRDFLSSFDPIARSGVYKTVSQFLSSSGEFVIIGDKLCLAQYLNVNSAEFSPNTSLSRKVDDHESEVYETNTNSNEPYCLDELKLAIPNTWTRNKVEQSRPQSNLNINSPAFTPRSSFSNPNDDDDNEVCVINKTFDNLKYKHEPLNVANPNTNSDDTNDPPRPHSNFNVNSPEFTPNMSSCLISPQSHNFNIPDFLSEKVNVPEFRPNTMALNIDDIPEFKSQPNSLNVNSPDFKPQGNTSDGDVLEFQPLPESISDSESEAYIPPVASAAFPATSVEFTPWGDDDSSEKSEYYDDFVDHEDESDSEYSGDEIGPFDQFPVESNVAAVIIGNNVEECHGNASNAKNLYSESYSYTSNNHELEDLEKRIPITCEVGTSNGEFWKQNDNLKDKIVHLRTESSIEIKKLKRIILEKQKKHCDAIIDNLTDKCRDKLSQWDIFRSSFLTESNKSHKIWALLEKEEAAWETRMISTREQADLVEQEYKTHLSSLHTVDANDIGFSLLSQPPKFLSEDTSMSRYEKLYKTALKLHTGDNSTDDDSEDEFSFNQEDTADEVSDEQQGEASLDQRESTEDEVSLNQEVEISRPQQESIENEVNHKQPESVENEVNHEQPESVQFAVRHNEQDKVHQASSESDGRNQPELSERDISCIQQDKATITLLEEISIEQQLSTATKSGHTNPCDHQAIHRDLYDLSPHHITTTKIENEDLYFLTSDNSREDSSLLEINQDDSEIYEDATSSNMKMTVIESEPCTVAKADVVHNTETVLEVVPNETENFLKSESADKDQPSSMRSTSEDDLPGMQSKESLASGMQSTYGLTFGIQSKDIVGSGMQSKDSVASGMQSKYGLTFGMQSKDDVVSGMQSKDIIASEIQSKDGITSGMPSKDGVASGMQSNYGLTFGMHSKDYVVSGMQSKDILASEIQSKDGITSGMPSKDGVASGVQSNYGLIFGMHSKYDVSGMQSKDNISSGIQSKDILASGMQSKYIIAPGMQSKDRDTSAMSSKDDITSGKQSKDDPPPGMQSIDVITSGMQSKRSVDSGMQSNYDLTFGIRSKVVSGMQSKDNITSRLQSKDILASAMPSKDNLPSEMESKFGLTFGMPSKDNIGSEMQFQGGIASERQSKDGIVSESQSGSVDLDVLEPKENIVATSVETARKDNMFKATGSGDAHPTKSADRSATIETSPTAVSKSSIVTGVDMKTSSLTVDQMTKNIFSALSVLQLPVSTASETLVSSSDTLGKPKTSDQSDLRNVADIPLSTSGPSTSSATSQSILFVPPSRELKFSQLKDSRIPNSSSKPKDAPSLKSLSTESLSLVGLARSRSTVQPATSHVPSSPAVRYVHGNGASLPASPNRQPPPPGFNALLSSGTTCTTTTTSTISSSWYMNNSSGPVGTPVPIRPPPGFSSVPPINPMYMAVPPGPMGFSPMQIVYPNMYAYPQYNMIRPGPMQTTFIPQSQGLQQAYPYGLSTPSQINQNTGVTPGTRGAQTGNTESTGDPSIIQIGNVCGTSMNPSTFYCQANNLRQSSTNAPMSSSKSASGNQNVLNQMAACADKVAQTSSANASKHNKPVVEKTAPSVTTAPTQATKTKKTKTPLSLRDILTDFRDEGDRDSDLEDDTFFDKPSSVKKTKPSKKDNPNGDRIRTLSERSNESRPRTLSQQSNESNLTEKGTQPKTGKKLVHLVNTSVHNGQTSSSIKKAVQLVNSSIDSGQASSSNSGSSGWTEVVRKSLAMKTYPILSTSLAGSSVSKTCGQRLLEHLIARFPSETSETLISLVKTVRGKHGKTLTGLSFELIETEVRLLLMKRQQQTRKDPDSASSGWEKFKGKAWGDTPCVQKTVEWQSSSQDNCSICLCPMRSYTTTLDCQHMFHTECIKDWFRKKSVCPFCMKYCTLNEEFPTLC